MKYEQMDEFGLANLDLPLELVDLGADFADDVFANLTDSKDSTNPGEDIMKELNDIAASCFIDSDELLSAGYYLEEKENQYPAPIPYTFAASKSINQIPAYSTVEPVMAPNDEFKDIHAAIEQIRSVCGAFSDWEHAVRGMEPVGRPVLDPIHNLLPKTKAIYATANSPAGGNGQEEVKPFLFSQPLPNPYSPVYSDEYYEEEEEEAAVPVRKISKRMSPYDFDAPRSSGSYKQRQHNSNDESEPKKRRYKKSVQMKSKKNTDRADVQYEYMAALALLNGANYVHQVYDFVTVNMPKCRTTGKSQSWKNSLREQLSKNYSGFFSKTLASESGRKKLNFYWMTEEQKKEFYERYTVSFAKPSEYLFNPDDFEAIYAGTKGLPTQAEVHEAKMRDEQMQAPIPQEYYNAPTQFERLLLANQQPQQLFAQPNDGFEPAFA